MLSFLLVAAPFLIFAQAISNIPNGLSYHGGSNFRDFKYSFDWFLSGDIKRLTYLYTVHDIAILSC